MLCASSPAATPVPSMIIRILFIKVRRFAPNGAPQEPGTTGVQNKTESSSRGCLKVLVRLPYARNDPKNQCCHSAALSHAEESESPYEISSGAPAQDDRHHEKDSQNPRPK